MGEGWREDIANASAQVVTRRGQRRTTEDNWEAKAEL